MRIVQLYAYALLLGGPIVSYRVANRWSVPRRWQVVAFCAAGGATGAIVLFATLLLTELSSFAALRPTALPFIGGYALIGLGLGLVSVMTPESVRHRLVLWCVTFAKQTWRRRGQVVLATLGAQLTVAMGVWLRPRLFPAPSVYVHTDAPPHSVRWARLPDETEVILSPGSHLSYSSWFAPHDERELTLNGEGTFAVARGARTALTLDAAGVEVSASNARFTVHAYNGEPVAYVIVREGLVRLRARRANRFSKFVTLGAGEGARVGPSLDVVRRASTFLLQR